MGPIGLLKQGLLFCSSVIRDITSHDALEMFHVKQCTSLFVVSGES